jgi:hypothetical protein
MAEVIGPCSTLPGAHHAVPEGTRCDEHEERLAVKRVQGETDSFGAELNDMCLGCYEAHKTSWAAYKEEQAHGICDWCRREATDRRQVRDWEEGSAGPLYDVCGVCIKRRNDEAEEELEASGYYDRQDDYYDYDPTETGEDDRYPEDELNYLKDMGRTIEEVLGNEPMPAMGIEAGNPKAYVDGKFYY